jgi:hypothetical protein
MGLKFFSIEIFLPLEYGVLKVSEFQNNTD